jgi:hypothetical protein
MATTHIRFAKWTCLLMVLSLFPGPSLVPASLAAAESSVEPPDQTAELGDAQIERVLSEGKVVHVKDLATGVTRPKRVWIELEGITASAGFKSVDIQQPGLSRMAGGKAEMNFSDRHEYERAAYLLDRRLGMNMVPVAVLREVEGEVGALTAWVDGTITEKDRQDEGIGLPTGKYETEVAVMRLFDALILNVDRNAGNVLYRTSDWRIFLIDHSRAFRLEKKLPELFEEQAILVTREIYANLRSLESQELEELLEDTVTRFQIKSLIVRRDKIVQRIEKERSERGDEAVFRSSLF